MKKEILVSGFWLLLSLYLAVESYRLGLSARNRPGPGFFPCGAAVGIAIIAFFRLLKHARQTTALDAPESAAGSEARLVIYVIAGMLAYALLFDALGFFFCTFFLVAFYLKGVAARSWLVSLSFAIAVALVSHLFFDVLLNTQLPRGMIDWLI